MSFAFLIFYDSICPIVTSWPTPIVASSDDLAKNKGTSIKCHESTALVRIRALIADTVKFKSTLPT